MIVRGLLCGCVLVPLIFSSAAADEKSSAPAPDAGGQGQDLQEITVSANRRSENVQKVTLAVSSFTAEDAATLGITDTQSLAAHVPGLTFNRQAGASTPFLRGVGSPASAAGREPSVAMYVDDVYMPYAGSSMQNFNTLERLEVEKGPQGTLFGRNATGGVVQIFTKNPTAAPRLDMSAGFTNYNTPSGSIYATGAIAPNLSANIAAYGSRQLDGWGTNVVTGADTYRQWDVGGRIKFLWEPSDTTNLLLAFDHDTTGTEEGVDLAISAGTKSVAGITAPPDFYGLRANRNPNTVLRQDGVSLKGSSEFSWARLVSISSARYLSNYERIDFDGGPTDLINERVANYERTYTQEFQLLSLPSSSLTWIAGAYLYRDTAGYYPISFAGGAFPFLQQNSFSAESTRSYSGFGQATATILPDTHLTLGLRYTKDTRKLEASIQTVPKVGPVPPPVTSIGSGVQTSWHKLTWRAVLDHQFTDDIMAYVGANSGFKSGLFNAVPAAKIAAPVNPEVLDAYTVGLKSEFLDHRLRVNLEGFYYKYKNIQVTTIIPTGSIISNAAGATMKGVDLDVTARVTQSLTLTASAEGIDAKYDDFANGSFNVYRPTGGNCTFRVVPGGPIPCGGLSIPPGYNAATGTWNLAGNKTLQTPPFSLSLAANYVIPTRHGDFDVNVTWNHSGNYYFDADNGRGDSVGDVNPDYQPIFNVVNASIGYSSTDHRWDVKAWTKNLTAQKYYSYRTQTGIADFYSAAPPRTFGINFTMHLF